MPLNGSPSKHSDRGFGVRFRVWLRAADSELSAYWCLRGSRDVDIMFGGL